MGSIIINGTNLYQYGLVASGGGTYVTPSRDVSAIEVPGRDGNLIRDNGRFKNVDVTYPCYIARDFPTKYENLRRALISQRGYMRIEDSYDPAHYRVGYFAASITPNTTARNLSGDFSLTFNCKPQRFRIDGEHEMTIGDYPGELHPRFSTVYQVIQYANLPQFIKDAIIGTPKDKYIRWTYGNGIEASHIKVVGRPTTEWFMAIVNGDGSAGIEDTNIIGEYMSDEISFTDVYTDYFPAARLELDGLLARTLGLLPASLYNITSYECKPLYRFNFFGSTYVEAGTLFSVNSGAVSTIGISVWEQTRGQDERFDAIYIDSDSMNAYAMSNYGRTINLNQYVQIDGDISLMPGVNDYGYLEGPTPIGRTNVEIIPRWYDI